MKLLSTTALILGLTVGFMTSDAMAQALGKTTTDPVTILTPEVKAFEEKLGVLKSKVQAEIKDLDLCKAYDILPAEAKETYKNFSDKNCGEKLGCFPGDGTC